MYKVYGIPNCDTIKKTLTSLKAKGIAFEFHNYKTEGISKEKIEEWLKQYTWEQLVNRSSTTWKQLSEEERPTTREAAIQLMMDKTSVIKRPIVEGEVIKAIGYNEELLEGLK